MKSLMTRPMISLLAMTFFTLTFVLAPSTANARWRSHYGDMPGQDFPTGLVVAAGVLTAGLITILIVKHHSGDRQTEEPKVVASPVDRSPSADSTKTKHSEVNANPKSAALMPQLRPQLGLYCRPATADQYIVKTSPATQMEWTVKAGIVISF